MSNLENTDGVSPRDLGKPFGLSPPQVNEILADAELQMHRPGRSGWTPTSAGVEFVQNPSVNPILWRPAVRDFLTSVVDSVSRFINIQCCPCRYARTPLPDLWQAYKKWIGGEEVGCPPSRNIFDTLVASLGAKCYPCPNGRIAVDLALVEEESASMHTEQLDAAQLKAALDLIDQFLETQCRQSETTRTPAVVFYDAYKDWMRHEKNSHPAGRKDFFDRLNYYGYKRQRNARGVRILIGLQLIERGPRLRVV